MLGNLVNNLIRTVGTLLAVVAALLVFTFWPEHGQVFGRPAAEVRDALKGLDLPPHVFGSVPKTVRVLTPSPGTMVWSIYEYENELMRYVVTLAAEGASATRVSVDVTKPNGAPLGNAAANVVRNRAVRNIYVIAMKEQIAAALEQRDFQTVKIVLPSVIAVLVNMTYISSWLSGAGNSPSRGA
jgi:hypothetical protein